MIPYEVEYKQIGKKKTRNVICIICPTVYNQLVGTYKVQPIYIHLGDIKVDWEKTSPAFEEYQRSLF